MSLLLPFQTHDLTDEHIVLVSDRMVSDSICIKLGTALGLEAHEIQTHLYNHQRDISSAAYYTLRNWVDNKEDRFEACQELATALTKCQMSKCVRDILMK